MTKKDYELIASVIHDRLENSFYLNTLEFSSYNIQTSRAVLAEIALFMANRLAQNNPKFDRTKFLEACGAAR